jgi:hypothetical protein
MIRTSVYSSVKAPGRPSPDQKHAYDRPAGTTQLNAGTWAIDPVHVDQLREYAI